MSFCSKLCLILLVLLSVNAHAAAPAADWPGAHLFVGVRGTVLDEATPSFLAEARPAAVAKHFPGQGSSVQDSHKAMATLPLEGDDLDRSLLPFKNASAASIDGIMTGHIACAALDSSSSPATLSRPMIEDVLRAKMGFRGLVITDDMNMGAVRGGTSLPEAVVKALSAGNDIALVCENDPARLRDLVRAIQAAQADDSLPQDQMTMSLNRVREL